MELSLPYALNAELTHRCPLRCPYCSNPQELERRDKELSTDVWLRILEEAAGLGVVQLHLTGGEPLLRADAELLIERARSLGLFVNMITSGVGLTEARLRRLAEAGVDSLQLSLQAATPSLSDHIAGFQAFDRKRQAAALIRAAGLPLNMNVVLHRHNIGELEAIVELCLSWGASRLELANTQYYGWALVNRETLMPTKEQLKAAEASFDELKKRISKQMELIWVVPDYYADLPKPCMGGWGRISLTVSPSGKVLPCPAASGIDTLTFDSVTERSLASIWYESAALNAFRGTNWMTEPCRSCERRFEDFGGCRCQAYLLTGDARQTDPVCRLSPHRSLISDAVTAANEAHPAASGSAEATPSYVYRGSAADRRRLLHADRMDAAIEPMK
ncbi:pyrroloquinoline quinone biosynthesis protein PqqE [Paenibacillus ehimensis]|uniref:pyrroloquinoline quinone biosynthesis protein PqqE n=1 Tax=Paenibacillus ehimensis TaxID=79264 RepID=UPI002DB6BADA|nr:pyrroloquinoline quinone biosynthesis protein PqqE [Paenibacillus ehimensis]MEC0209999.1 pyrroloquinoline quinone biosynthesis protein PqqE [Paenibacillus ehimensis]